MPWTLAPRLKFIRSSIGFRMACALAMRTTSASPVSVPSETFTTEPNCTCCDRPLTTKLERDKVIIVGDKWLTDVHRSPGEDEIDIDEATLSLCAYAVDKKVESTKDSEVKDDVSA